MTKSLKIDSASVGLYMAKEASINTLPLNPKWQQMEPSEIGDVGGETTQTSRTIIRPDRQNNRGAITDLSASADFTQELSQNNADELFQGFCFAKAHEPWRTKWLNDEDTGTTVTAGSDTYTLGDTDYDVTGLKAGSLLKASGFKTAGNNGLKVVESVASGVITVATGTATAEAVGAGVLEVVGFTGSASITTSGQVKLVLADADELGLEIGQWIFVGGDTNKFADNGAFFARIGEISDTGLVLDFTDKELAAEASATVDIFWGITIHNEKDIDKIRRTTYGFRAPNQGCPAKKICISQINGKGVTFFSPPILPGTGSAIHLYAFALHQVPCRVACALAQQFQVSLHPGILYTKVSGAAQVYISIQAHIAARNCRQPVPSNRGVYGRVICSQFAAIDAGAFSQALRRKLAGCVVCMHKHREAVFFFEADMLRYVKGRAYESPFDGVRPVRKCIR